MPVMTAAAVVAITLAQARYIAEHPSKYSIVEVHDAIEMLRVPEPADPENPSDRYIAEHASHYSVFQVHAAVERLKARPQ